MTSSTIQTDRTSLHQTIAASGIGTVESWVELMNVELPLLSFRYTFVFRKGRERDDVRINLKVPHTIRDC